MNIPQPWVLWKGTNTSIIIEERFDLVMQKKAMDSEPIKKLLEILNTPAFRREAAHFSGNDYRDLGKIVMEV